MNIFTPNSKSLPQQVDANTKSIENLTKMCPRIYHARTEIDISSTTTLLSYTDVDTNAMDNAILIAQNATIFKINGKTVDDSGNVILYIEFICTMLENKGDKGDTGETGATGLPALECSRVYNSPTQPLLNEIITIPLTALNRTPVSGDSIIVLYNYYENTENNTIGSYLVNATFSSLTTQEASFEIINVVSNTGKAGDGFAFKGVWVAGTVYNKNDVVTYTSNNITKSYVALVDNLSSATIPPSNSNWELFTSGVENSGWTYVGPFTSVDDFKNYLTNNTKSNPQNVQACVRNVKIDVTCRHVYFPDMSSSSNYNYTINISNNHYEYFNITFSDNSKTSITFTNRHYNFYINSLNQFILDMTYFFASHLYVGQYYLTDEQIQNLIGGYWYFKFN